MNILWLILGCLSFILVYPLYYPHIKGTYIIPKTLLLFVLFTFAGAIALFLTGLLYVSYCINNDKEI